MASIKRNNLVNVLNENPNQIFGLLYQKANGEMRKATCRLHVSNHQHCQAPGAGSCKGISEKEALERYNNLIYFDLNAKGTPTATQTPGKGNYRIAKIDSIKSVTMNNVTYDVIDQCISLRWALAFRAHRF